MIFFLPSFFGDVTPITVSCEASETGCGVLANSGLISEYRKEKISNGR